MRAAIALLAALLTAACAPEVRPAASRVEHVVIISIDGLRPEFYLGGFDAPVMERLAREGAHARAVETVFPSVTYPAHASIVTGVRPARHGIHNNNLFGTDGNSPEGYWDASLFRCRTLWDAVREAGGTVGLVGWPTTAGAEVDWCVPELWTTREGESPIGIVRDRMSPEFVAELDRESLMPGDEEASHRAVLDRYLTGIAAYLIREHRPQLLLLHIVNTDFVQHDHGREAPQVRDAVTEADVRVGEVWTAIEEAGLAESTLLIVTGDHGFIDISREVRPNALMAQAGWIDLDGRNITAWRAVAWKGGAQAGVYVADEARARAGELQALFESRRMVDGAAAYRVLDRAQLDAMGYDPAAAFALVSEPGWVLGGSVSGEFVSDSTSRRGNHGFLPTEPQMATGFVAYGASVRPGTSADRLRTIDIAPTIAWLTGLSMPGCEGDVRAEFFDAGD